MATINKKKQVIVCFPLYLYPNDTQKENGGYGDLFGGALFPPPLGEGKGGGREKSNGQFCASIPHLTSPKGGGTQEDNVPQMRKTEEDNVTTEWELKPKRQPNFDPKILQKIACGLGLRFVSDHEGDINSPPSEGCPEGTGWSANAPKKTTPSGFACHPSTGGELVKINKPTLNPLDILDYIYAVLHSPTYRETYKEFLKIDFPKIPYPTDTQKFWQLVSLGREIRLYHLLEHPSLAEFDASYPQGGDNKITTKISTKDFIVNDTQTHGKLMINDTQFFDNIPVTAWDFYIGGYQPAQKWLKDRQGRKLNYDDIQHYQKIIKSLHETHKIMQKIDAVYMNINNKNHTTE